MQMAVIEAARHLAGLPQAGSTEFGSPGDPVVGLMTEWSRGNEVERRNVQSDLGGTMRLGAYPCILKEGSRVRDIYRSEEPPSELQSLMLRSYAVLSFQQQTSTEYLLL